MLRAIACAACLLGVASRSVALSMGQLEMSAFSRSRGGDVAAAAPLPAGPWVVSISPDVALGDARAAVIAALAAASRCGAVAGVLPPSALLLHVRSAAPCAAALAALSPALIDGLAAMPAHLRTDASSPAARRRALSSAELPPPPPPLRSVALLLAADYELAALERFVATALADSCPTCVVVGDAAPLAAALSALGGSPRTASVLSAGARCAARCELSSPADCGCLISADAVAALAGYADVLWLNAVPPRRTSNAFSRGVTMTTDLPDATLFGGEWGACSDLGACAQLADAPFSVLPALYPAALTGRGASRSAAVDAPVPAGACSALCASPACGQGFATCAALESPLTALGLNGSGQLLHILDSGLDYTHPLFADAGVAVAPSQVSSPLPLSAAHRKLASYYAFCDAYDELGGHGTHTSGTLAGAANLSAVDAADASVLAAVHGVAPAARILFGDTGCSTPGGCVLPPDAPNGTCPNNNTCPADGNAIYVPQNLAFVFLPPYLAGARVTSNSWGSGEGAAYSAESYILDALAYVAADLLLLFAAGNAGAAGNATVGVQASAKNVLSVGAAIAGLQAQAGALRGGAVVAGGARLPPLSDYNSYSGCGAVLRGAALAGFGCPAGGGPPTAAECFAVAAASIAMGPLPFVGYRSPYPTDAGNMTMDAALCCGCTPRQVLDGAADAGALNATLLAFEAIYNARETVAFSSRGPTSDGRIAPNLIAPGTYIVSAYGSGTLGAGSPVRAYGDFRCAAGGASASGDPGAADAPSTRALALVGRGLPASLGSYAAPVLALVELLTLEPTVLQQVTVNVSAVAAAGTLYLQLVDAATSATSSVFSAALAVGDASATLLVNVTLRAGQSTFLAFFADTNFTAPTAAAANATQAACFGAIGYSNTSILTALITSRGAGIAYTARSSGTSMATPHVAGLAALARQYLTAGFFPSGVRTPAAGFAPSSALLKALLVNSASPVMEPALAALLSLPPPMAPPLVMTNDAGAGVVNLMRGLAFASALLPNATALLIPGLTFAPYAAPAVGLPPPDGAPLLGVDPALINRGVRTFCVDVSAELPTWLSITLVWTDPPALPPAAIQLVNNLDLEVTPPGGDASTPLRGNNDGDQSPQTADVLNNVEKLYIASPVRTLTRAGVRLAPAYAVRVRGTAVVIAPQAFSLVVNGVGAQLAPSGTCGDAALPAASTSGLSVSQELGLGIGIGLGVALALVAAASAAATIVVPLAAPAAGGV